MLIGLLVVALVGCNAVSKSEEQSRRITKSVQTPSAQASVALPSVVPLLYAPAPWRLVSKTSDAPLVYRNADDSAQVTISQFPAKTQVSPEVRARDLRKFLELRRGTERHEMGASMTASEPRFDQTTRWITADYLGRDPEVHNRFATLVMVSNELSGVIFLEAADSLDEKQFQRLAKDLFDRVVSER